MSTSEGLRPVPLSPSQGTVELSSLASPREGSPANTTSVHSCLASCWKVISWTFSIVTYIIELFVYVWVIYVYADGGRYYLFGLSLGFLVFPTVFIASLSLVWYYNLDRFHRRRRERDPHNMEFIEYRKKFTIWALLLHILLLGVVYRYSQLIYLTLIGKRRNLPYLHRDAILVRFFHSFLSSAPHLILHLYATIVAFSSSSNPLSSGVLSALAISAVSVLYSILSFATNDRVSGKNRRVVLPAHLTQMFWHVCMVLSRVLGLALFAYVFEYFVVAVVGGHWLVMLFLLLLERTTFCADIERQNNGGLKFTRRLCLEIPFDVLAAFVYVFVYFNPKRGRTRVWAGIYHLVTLAENAAMGALFYVHFPSDSNLPSYFPLSGTILIIGLYVVGMTFMFCYYLIYHPKRTESWHWIGFPRNCRCCCCRNENREQEIVGTKYQNRNSRVIISGPTLVSHNGFVPKNLLPVGPNAMGVVNHEVPSMPSINMPNGRMRSRDRSMTEPDTRRTNGGSVGVRANSGVPPVQELDLSMSLMSPNSTNTSRTNTARTAGESNPAFSDFLQSDTDFSSNAVEANDTVIDTPLFGPTPEGMISISDARLMHMSRIMSQDNESQKTYTNDTGIDVDSDLHELSPGGDIEAMDGAVGGVSSSIEAQGHEDVGKVEERRLPIFVDVPTKQRHFKSGGLERHYFPNQDGSAENHSSRVHNRGSVTPTLPTPTYSPSPSPTRRHPSDEDDVFHRDPRNAGRAGSPLHSGSQTSPDRPRKAPRSPIGARAHQVNMDDGDLSGSQRSTHTPTSLPGVPPPRAVTPRSPKGARRLLIQQASPVPGSPPRQDRMFSAQSRRKPPPPPLPPKSRHEMLSESLPPVFTSSSVATTATETTVTAAPAQRQVPRAPSPPHQATPRDTPSDGLTRGLLSLVPRSAAERRAQSSSPFPNSRQHTQRADRVYLRSASYNPNAPPSPERIPRGVSNYKRASVLETQGPTGGSVHSMQHYHMQQRPKSDGWRTDRSTAVQMLNQRGRNAYHQTPLNSHGSSPERTGHNSMPRGQRFSAIEDTHRRQDLNRSRPKSSINPYSPHTPKSAFNRVSPERSRAHHVGRGAGPRHSQRSQLTESYPAARPTSTSGANIYPPSRSPRRYPKAPQGAVPNAPRMTQRSVARNIVPVPPPLPPPRKDPSINEPVSELNSSSLTHSLGAGNKSISSGNYDRLPADVLMVEAGPAAVNRANRGSFISPTTLHPPMSSAHESVV